MDKVIEEHGEGNNLMCRRRRKGERNDDLTTEAIRERDGKEMTTILMTSLFIPVCVPLQTVNLMSLSLK